MPWGFLINYILSHERSIILLTTYNVSKFPFLYRAEVEAAPVGNNEMSP